MENPDILSSHLVSDLCPRVHCSVKTAQSMAEVRVHRTQAVSMVIWSRSVFVKCSSVTVKDMEHSSGTLCLSVRPTCIQDVMQNILFSLGFNTETWKRVRGQEY